MSNDIAGVLLIALISFVCAGMGAYLGSYLKKKGENLATHEDMNKIVALIEATTEATKAIEARISHEVWDRQRQWEIKREVLLTIIDLIAESRTGMERVATLNKVATARVAGDRERFAEMESEIINDWVKFVANWDSVRMRAALVCESRLVEAIDEVSKAIGEQGRTVFDRQPITMEKASKLQDLIGIALHEMRIELKSTRDVMTKASTSQSSESSAAPTPGS
jgi:hypothetical protein